MTTTANDQVPPSGEQYEIAYARHRVVVSEVGATLRQFNVDGLEVIDGFELSERASDGRGQVLSPWPNRLGDGSYSFEGVNAHAALDEPERLNAIHGLVRWLGWNLVGRAQNVVTLSTVLQPQPGYPWRLFLTIEYRLGRDGLTVTTEARNGSDTAAPFGLGFHPYTTIGTPTVDTARLTVRAKSRLVSNERGLPTGVAEVTGTEFDFRKKRLIGPTALDTGFCDFDREDDETIRVHLEHPDKTPSLTVWADRSFKYFMIYTADHVTDPSRARSAVAIEPMTCPPDAFRSGTDVVRLAPGASWRGSWGISVQNND